MNMLAAMAEMVMWRQENEDRSVVDTAIEEFSDRMGELAKKMHEIYADAVRDYINSL